MKVHEGVPTSLTLVGASTPIKYSSAISSAIALAGVCGHSLEVGLAGLDLSSHLGAGILQK